ncbi:MAG: peptidoglycan bridge formation glycyltransferase FemA/FemB family protein [Bacilli bacterium]|nr:peptidoglycan bridge formation glycyltransferase FemA/FemB family protein [Bacilli bacterium]
MNFIENIDEFEYEEFVKNNDKSHFMQSYYWGEVMKYKNFKPHYVGLKENGKIVATALLLKKKLIGKYCYFYCPRGYILDYQNKSLIKIFTDKLKKYAKKNKCLFIKIDPDIKLHDLDSDGNIIGNDNYQLVEYLKKLGYNHTGFNTNFVNEQPRFTFRLSINKSFDDIYSNIHPTTKKILNKGNQYNLNLYKGNINDIPKFYETMIETAQRENLKLTSIKYYETFYSVLNKKNMSDLYIVEVNINDLINVYNEKINKVSTEINELDNPKYKNKDKILNIKNDLTKQIEKLKEELNNTKNINQEKITLSSIITVKYDNKVWTIHGGNSNLLRELNSNYLLYYSIIKDAYEAKYEIVDFFGTSGIANPDKNDPIFGIHSFKKRFGGEYTEFIGEFNLIINKTLYYVYKTLLPIYRKFK